MKNPPSEVVPVIIHYMKKAGPNDRLEFNCLGGAYSNIKSNDTSL